MPHCIFRDIERLKRILNNPDRPVQIIFAGKAHPADEPGKALIEQVYTLSRTSEFKGKVVFLENYDIDMARYLVSGTDVWLNNPIRPTRQAAPVVKKLPSMVSPIVVFSMAGGSRAINGKNGWAIGEEREYHDQEAQAEADSISLYRLLEEEIVPTFFDRGSDGVPHRLDGAI